MGVVDPMLWVGGATMETSPNGSRTEGGQDGSKQGPNSTGCETDQLRSRLLPEVGPGGNVQDIRARRCGGVVWGLHEELSCTMIGSREASGGVCGVL